ncbi:MAG: CoA transferase [Dehalococcoidia bacterium]|nr:CoA transferase [Dehalococcoidia bacterium]MCA9845966.1 CoA transferase [Dehalococcoidia bacterium]
MTTALEGLRILDMTQYEAGTSATQMLAWLGADVIKVEPPRGDAARQSFVKDIEDPQYFMNYNANKRSIVLDLKHPQGRELMLRLAEQCDVFVENYGPGIMEELGIDYEEMRKRNPAIIYGRLKGFGLDGPYANYKCFDPLAQAAAGTFSVTGTADGPPVKPGPTMSDTGTGMQMALAITAAWVQKLRTGEGQFIEISMQEATTMFMRTTGVVYWAEEPVPRQVHKAGAPSGMYPCKGGGPNDYLYMLVSTTRMWDQLCVAMGRDDLLTDPRFETPKLRNENQAELDAEIARWTLQHDKHEAMRILCEGGVAASAIFDTMDVFNDPHLNARGFIERVEHPTEGEVVLMKSPIRMSKSEVPLAAPPLLGGSTNEVLGELLHLDADQLNELWESGVTRPTLKRKQPVKQEAHA